MASILVIEIKEDGTLKTDASKVVGDEAEILAELEELAALAGGELKVEAHKPGIHHHHHGHTHSHVHGSRGGKR